MVEEEKEKRAKLKKQALKVQSDNKAFQEQQQRMQAQQIRRAVHAASALHCRRSKERKTWPSEDR